MDVNHIITFVLGMSVGLIPLLTKVIGDLALERGVQKSQRRIIEEEEEEETKRLTRKRKH